MKRAKLIAARYSKGWTQEEAAERIGVIRGTISQWERGIVAPHPFYVHQLCTVFDQTASELGLEKLVGETSVQQEMKNGSGEPNIIAERLRTEAPGSPLFPTTREQSNEFVSRDGVQRTQEQSRAASNILILPSTITQPEKPTERALPDCGTTFGIRLAQTMIRIQQWYGMAMFCSDLQCQIDQEIKNLEALKSQHSSEEYALSRKSFLVSIAALPTAHLASAKQGHRLVLELEEVLPQCAASIIACWDLSGGSHLDIIEPILASYLPTLISTVKYVPAYREVAATLVAQIYSLKAILAWHLDGLKNAEIYCVQAFNYSIIAENTDLQLTALNQHALISFYAKNFQQALAKSEEASMTLDQTRHKEHVFPIVQGRVFMYLAAIQAQQGLQIDAERTVERAKKTFDLQTPSTEPVPLYADCGKAPLTLWNGLMHYYLGQQDKTHARQALSSLQMFGQLQPSSALPERFRLECLNSRILAATQLNEMEEAIICFEAGKQGARALDSKQRSVEVEYAYQKILKQWPTETRVQL